MSKLNNDFGFRLRGLDNYRFDWVGNLVTWDKYEFIRKPEYKKDILILVDSSGRTKQLTKKNVMGQIHRQMGWFDDRTLTGETNLFDEEIEVDSNGVEFLYEEPHEPIKK